MLEKTLKLVNKLGLHIRASSSLVECTSRYLSDITITYNHKTADAKRIFDIMLLGATYGDTLMITVKGSDEEEAMQAVTTLISNKFGEAE